MQEEGESRLRYNLTGTVSRAFLIPTFEPRGLALRPKSVELIWQKVRVRMREPDPSRDISLRSYRCRARVPQSRLMDEILDRTRSLMRSAGWQGAICVVKGSFGGSRARASKRKRKDRKKKRIEETPIPFGGGERERRADSRTNAGQDRQRETD